MNKSLILYYAEWCGACKSFKPEWNKIKETLDKKGIKYEEYESDRNPDIMTRDNIMAFPTIKIKDNNKITEYEGPRTHDAIVGSVTGKPNQAGGGGVLKSLIQELNNNYQQSGGNVETKRSESSTSESDDEKSDDDEKYKGKYYKYKAKYMKARFETNN